MIQELVKKWAGTIPIVDNWLRYFWRIVQPGIREFYYRKWVLDGYLSPAINLAIPQKVTVIVPSYHRYRSRNLQPMVRLILKCGFVEKLIISNHNPEICLHDWVRTDDARIAFIDQTIRRGCGYGWIVASQEAAEYFIVIDDDMLIYPKQLSVLFEHLVNAPESPHGLTGRRSDGEYIKNQDAEVVFLYQIYAVTQSHIQKYLDYVREIIAKGYASPEAIEFWGDDLILSQTGTAQPRIHKAGSIFHCKTAKAAGVATSIESQFDAHRLQVYRALVKVKADTGVEMFNTIEPTFSF
ncbi:MAG: glycosyltransferase family A protein [Methylococcales bacterium]